MTRCRFCSSANTQFVNSSSPDMFVCNDCGKEFYSGEYPKLHRMSLVNHF